MILLCDMLHNANSVFSMMEILDSTILSFSLLGLILCVGYLPTIHICIPRRPVVKITNEIKITCKPIFDPILYVWLTIKNP